MHRTTIYPARRVCANIHDFTLLLTEMCIVNSEDPSREGRVHNPRYEMRDIKIYGNSADREIRVWFPKGCFPLSIGNFCDLEKALHVWGVYLRDNPDAVTAYKPAFNYELTNPKVKDRYVEKVGYVPDGLLGFIRPTETGRQVHAIIMFDKIKDRFRTERILESIITNTEVWKRK